MQNHPDLVLITQVTFAPTHGSCGSPAKLLPIPLRSLVSLAPLYLTVGPLSSPWPTRCALQVSGEAWYDVLPDTESGHSLSHHIIEPLCSALHTAKTRNYSGYKQMDICCENRSWNEEERPHGDARTPTQPGFRKVEHSSERGKHWGPRAALTTCIRSKHVLRPLLMPCHEGLPTSVPILSTAWLFLYVEFELLGEKIQWS